MKGLLLESDYLKYRDPPAMRLFLKRGEEVVTVLDSLFRDYFYVVTKNPDRTARAIKKIEVEKGKRSIRPESVEVEKRCLRGEEKTTVKVTVSNPRDIKSIRKQVRSFPDVEEVYEFDIPTARCYLIDHELTPMSGVEVEGDLQEGKEGKRLIAKKPPKPAGEMEEELNVMAFDTEVYCSMGEPKAERDPLIMVSLADNRGFKKVLTWKEFGSELDYVEVLKDEKEMLEQFIQLIDEREVDILFGYNTDLFDFPYLRDRADRLGIELNLGRDGSGVKAQRRRFDTVTSVPGRVHADVYAMVEFLSRIGALRLMNLTLENVYDHILGEEKLDLEPMEISRCWKEGGKMGAKLLRYSLSDAEAALELGLELLPLFEELSRLVNQSLFDVTRMTPGQLVEWLLIFNAHKVKELVPARPVGMEYRRRRGKTYVGAYVVEPEKGLHEDLVVFDYRSLYPTIIITHNIDPSTLNRDCEQGEVVVPELNYKFCQEPEGFIPRVLKVLVKDRAKLKAQMKQYEEGSREYMSIYNRQWALKILANSFYGLLGYPRARWYSRECAESVTSFGRRYIKDTIKMAEDEGFEVVYGDTDSLHCKLNGKNQEDVDEFLEKVNENLPGIMELELEDFYKRGVFVTKKRYAMITEDGKMIVKGLEFVRRDWALLARETQERVLEAILKGASPEEAAKIVRDTTKAIKERNVELEGLAIHTQLKKALDEYKSRGPHVAAAERLRECGEEVEPGTTITYIVEKGSGSISERAIPVSEFGDRDYDADYYIEHQVLPAVMRIMEVLGYEEDDLRYGRAKQVKLGKFE